MSFDRTQEHTVLFKIVVPHLGATDSGVIIQEWFARPGEWLKAGEPLFSVTTDKATVEVEAFRDGYLRAILANSQAIVQAGAPVGILADTLDETLDSMGIELRAAATSQQTTGTPAHSVPAVNALPDGNGVSPLSGAAHAAKLEDAPIQALSTGQLLEMFRSMVLIRRFEDYLYQLFLQGLVPGTLHQYQGQEAVAVGVCAALREDDVIFSTHRPVGHLIAKGAQPREIAAEIWGKATGCAGGKGGQMHLTDMRVGAMPSNAIVGANIPIAAGAALGFMLQGVDRIAVSFFGDAASNIGAFHEGINLAAVKNAPVIFVCENNLYGASTHISLSTRVTDIAQRADAYGIPGKIVDGMDVIAMYHAAREAVHRARSGLGPTLLECKTYRYAGHSRGDPGGYRTRQEIQLWRERDPIPRLRAYLIEQHQQRVEDLQAIENTCQAQVEAAVEFAQASPTPAPESLLENVYAD